MLIEDPDWSPTTKKILDACFEVHREIGPGLLESVYEDALALEFARSELEYRRQNPISVLYKGQLVGDPFRPDFDVEDKVILEIKAVEKIHPVHEAQLMTYLFLTGRPVGLIVNFHSPLLKDGVRRFLNPRLLVVDAMG